MRSLFSPAGMLCLQNLTRFPSVLIFDLDGTLAPLVAHYSNARVPTRTANYLVSLSRSWPIAVVTGRSVKDAQGRLGFTPDYLFGNHGAERADLADKAEWASSTPSPAANLTPSSTPSSTPSGGLDTIRQYLHQHATAMTHLKAHLEDKGLSLALHYRQSENPVLTRAWLHSLIGPVRSEVLVTDGHCVVNILQPHAPGKGDALKTIMLHCRAESALVVGDDDNDEPAFAMAPELAVTVRIAPAQTNSRAKFRLDSQHQVDLLLEFFLKQKNFINQHPAKVL